MMDTAKIKCYNIHNSGDVEDIKEEYYKNNSTNNSAKMFCSINEPDSSVADTNVPQSFNVHKVMKFRNYRGKIKSKMKQSNDSIESSDATNDSTCVSKGSSEKDDKLMIMKQDQSNPGCVKSHNNDESTHDSKQSKIPYLMEKLVDYVLHSQHDEDVAQKIEDIEKKLQYQEQLVHKTGKKLRIPQKQSNYKEKEHKMKVNDLNKVIIHQKKNYRAQALQNQVRNLQQQLQKEKYNSICLLEKAKCNEGMLFKQLNVVSNQLQMAQQNGHFKEISNGFLMRQNNELQSN